MPDLFSFVPKSGKWQQKWEGVGIARESLRVADFLVARLLCPILRGSGSVYERTAGLLKDAHSKNNHHSPSNSLAAVHSNSFRNLRAQIGNGEIAATSAGFSITRPISGNHFLTSSSRRMGFSVKREIEQGERGVVDLRFVEFHSEPAS